MPSRKKMCGNKATFWNKANATRNAEKYGQRVYECPICFCWHCTSKEDWRQEYVDADWHTKEMNELERRLRTEYNAILAKKNRQINKLQYDLSEARRG